MQVDNLSETWWETNIPALAAHIGNRLPIFVADRPADNPKSVAFGRTDQPLQSERQRPVALASRQLNISLTGYNPA
jgi:hypothetical protein